MTVIPEQTSIVRYFSIHVEHLTWLSNHRHVFHFQALRGWLQVVMTPIHQEEFNTKFELCLIIPDPFKFNRLYFFPKWLFLSVPACAVKLISDSFLTIPGSLSFQN